MSRSRKKVPVISVACYRNKAQQFYKRRARVKIRRTGLKDLGNNCYYKRLDERWMWPDDGKQWWENPRAYRK